MPPTLEELGLDTLSPEDRIALGHLLLDSVQDSSDGGNIAPELRAELERRSARADADPSGGIPWEVVRAAARARWQR